MALSVVHPDLFIGALLFYTGFLYLFYRFQRDDDDFGDFSVGLTYRDVFVLIVMLVPIIAGFSYLLLALGLGFVTVDGREIAYLRYFEWMVTTPIMLFGIGMLAQDAERAADLVILDMLFIGLTFAAAVASGPLKMMLFLGAVAAFLGMMHVMVVRIGAEMSDRSRTGRHLYRRLRVLVLISWSLYLLIWAASPDGFGLVGITAAADAFIAMDLLAKLGYGLIVVRAMGGQRTIPGV